MKQPEALHHADYIEHWNPDDPIAKELRRLHEANQAMLEALKAVDLIFTPAARDVTAMDVIDKARAAIAKGEQQ